MKKRSAGILLYRSNDNGLEVLLAHPGGPFYKKRDLGVWSIPKGEFNETENPEEAAIREFKEELGAEISGEMVELSPIVQKSGKEVIAWAVKGEFNPESLISNTFPMEWPPKSEKFQEFAEVDRVEWFDIETAKEKIIPGQVPLLAELVTVLDNKLQ